MPLQHIGRRVLARGHQNTVRACISSYKFVQRTLFSKSVAVLSARFVCALSCVFTVLPSAFDLPTAESLFIAFYNPPSDCASSALCAPPIVVRVAVITGKSLARSQVARISEVSWADCGTSDVRAHYFGVQFGNALCARTLQQIDLCEIFVYLQAL